MHDEELEALFLEAWRRTGELYLTRREIAARFGFSDGWVQLMLIKTQAEPRKVSCINQKRIDYGLDMRLINRKKNLSKCWCRKYIAMLCEAECGLEAARPDDPSVKRLRKKLINRRVASLRGLRRQLAILHQLCPKDPLVKDIEEILDGDF